MDALRVGGILMLALLLAGCQSLGTRQHTIDPRAVQNPGESAQLAAEEQAIEDPLKIDEQDVPANLSPVISYVKRVDQAARVGETLDRHADSTAEVPRRANVPVSTAEREPAAPITLEPEAAESIATGADEPTTRDQRVTVPPLVTDIRVNGGSQPTIVDDTGAVEADDPNPNASAVAVARPVSLQEVLDRYFSNPSDESFRAQLDARVMRVIAGDDAGAREPFSLVSQEQQELGQRFVEALIAIRELHLGNLDSGVQSALRQIEPLVQRLSDACDLSIPTLAICSRIDNFGNYTPIEPPEFVTGKPIAFALYCEVAHLVGESRDDGFVHSELAMQTQVLSDTGEIILNLDDGNIKDRTRTRRRDFFIPRVVRLPATVAPGDYVVKVTITDKLGQKVAQNLTTFRVIVPE